MSCCVRVTGVPSWLSATRLLGEGDWVNNDGVLEARLNHGRAAEVDARLRGVVLNGRAIEVSLSPRPKRTTIRSARTDEARRRRESTPGFLNKQVKLDEEGRFSLTPEVLALALGRESRGQTVLDACCGAGGNAIGFARSGATVVACEIDPGRLRLARHNAKVYRVSEQIQFHQGDARALIPHHPADVLFIDPPWGPNYRAPTQLSDYPLVHDLLDHSERFAHIWLKLPPSFLAASLPLFVPSAVFGHAAGDRQRVKFLLLKLLSR